MITRTGVLAWMLILIAAVACGRDEGPRGQDARIPPPPVRGPIPAALVGTWTVVDYAPMGVSALDQAQVEERLGRTAYFGADSAASGERRCQRPGYSEHTVDADSYFVVGYNVSLRSAKVRPGPGGRLRVTAVECEGDPAPALSDVLWSGRDTIALDDGGVLFFLRRGP